MKPRQQKIIRERRQYNQWVNSQTLEDYALRFTAQSARKSTSRVGNTALGPIAFLACEAIGGTITLLYGFENTAWAIGVFAAVSRYRSMFPAAARMLSFGLGLVPTAVVPMQGCVWLAI